MESLTSAQAFVVPSFTFDHAFVVASLVSCQAFVATSLAFSNCWVTDSELVSLAVEFSSAGFDCLQPTTQVAMARAARIDDLLFIVCLLFMSSNWVCCCWRKICRHSKNN